MIGGSSGIIPSHSGSLKGLAEKELADAYDFVLGYVTEFACGTIALLGVHVISGDDGVIDARSWWQCCQATYHD
jgi:hypothetical protein